MFNSNNSASATTFMTAPATGKCVPLHAIYNSDYSSGTLGEGFAIVPSEGTVSAPLDCAVTRVSQSRRCVVLKDTRTDYEILVAADYYQNSGSFQLCVQPGDVLAKGDTLFTFDIGSVDLGSGSVTVPCVITNMNSASQLQYNYGDAVRGKTTVCTSAV